MRKRRVIIVSVEIALIALAILFLTVVMTYQDGRGPDPLPYSTFMKTAPPPGYPTEDQSGPIRTSEAFLKRYYLTAITNLEATGTQSRIILITSTANPQIVAT